MSGFWVPLSHIGQKSHETEAEVFWNREKFWKTQNNIIKYHIGAQQEK